MFKISKKSNVCLCIRVATSMLAGVVPNDECASNFTFCKIKILYFWIAFVGNLFRLEAYNSEFNFTAVNPT